MVERVNLGWFGGLVWSREILEKDQSRCNERSAMSYLRSPHDDLLVSLHLQVWFSMVGHLVRFGRRANTQKSLNAGGSCQVKSFEREDAAICLPASSLSRSLLQWLKTYS